MRGGRSLPKFFVHFSQTVFWVNLRMGRRGWSPLPKFFGTLALKKKKVEQVVQIGGEEGGMGLGNLDKKNSYFFFVKPSLIAS